MAGTPGIYTAMMAHTFGGDPSHIFGWYCSRKLNGNRAIWNGFTLQTLGRYSGSKIIYAPQWWVRSALPQGRPLDGELWHTSDDKDILRSIAGQGMLKSVNDTRWADVRYVAFDFKPYSCYAINHAEFVSANGNYVAYNGNYWDNPAWYERQEIINETFVGQRQRCASEGIPCYLIHHDQHRIDNIDNYNIIKLLSEAPDSSNKVWEGLVFANPSSPYECKRSHNLLKSKPMYDHEAYVNGIEHGDGKHIGRVGALKCMLIWNEQVLSFKGGHQSMVGQRVSFNVGGGLTDDLREKYMDVASLPKAIRFSFLEVSKYGIPQSANYLEEV